MKVNEIISEAGLGSLALKGLGKLFGKSAGKSAGKSVGKSAGKATSAAADIEKSAIKSVAQKSVSGLGATGHLLKLAFGSEFLYELFEKYHDLEQQYKRYQSGDMSTKIFGNASESDAKSIFDSKKTEMVGEAMLVVGPMLTKTDVVWKILGAGAGKVGSLAGGITGSVVGSSGGLLGSLAGAKYGSKFGAALAGMPFNIAAFLSKLISGGVTGTLFVSFVASDAGQKFLHEVMKDSLTNLLGNVGEISFIISDKAFVWFTQFAKSIYNNLTNQPTDAGSTTTGGTNTAASDTQAGQKQTSTKLTPEQEAMEKKYNKYPLNVRFDRTNPNIMYVGKDPVTDKDGLLRGNMDVSRVERTAKRMGLPSPLDNIPRRPGSYYF